MSRMPQNQTCHSSFTIARVWEIHTTIREHQIYERGDQGGSGWATTPCPVRGCSNDLGHYGGACALPVHVPPPPSGHAQALAHAQARRRTRIGPAKLTLCPDHASLDLSTADPAEDRAGSNPAHPLFHNPQMEMPHGTREVRDRQAVDQAPDLHD